ncbi:hypothetical protein BJ508DRAFT_310953 [Ascobolus immersus RN42]|uniref:Uncharacterized protein n=1 Tax=Ascobolus immersus RN42 TaxID=1160509 RepID=A0A3N4HTB8_ASCIM|nr:hypothetical protein BJ508DRAFT_310953 [Ascobolus immersus RN42]
MGHRPRNPVRPVVSGGHPDAQTAIDRELERRSKEVEIASREYVKQKLEEEEKRQQLARKTPTRKEAAEAERGRHKNQYYQQWPVGNLQPVAAAPHPQHGYVPQSTAAYNQSSMPNERHPVAYPQLPTQPFGYGYDAAPNRGPQAGIPQGYEDVSRVSGAPPAGTGRRVSGSSARLEHSLPLLGVLHVAKLAIWTQLAAHIAVGFWLMFKMDPTPIVGRSFSNEILHSSIPLHRSPPKVLRLQPTLRILTKTLLYRSFYVRITRAIIPTDNVRNRYSASTSFTASAWENKLSSKLQSGSALVDCFRLAIRDLGLLDTVIKDTDNTEMNSNSDQPYNGVMEVKEENLVTIDVDLGRKDQEDKFKVLRIAGKKFVNKKLHDSAKKEAQDALMEDFEGFLSVWSRCKESDATDGKIKPFPKYIPLATLKDRVERAKFLKNEAEYIEAEFQSVSAITNVFGEPLPRAPSAPLKELYPQSAPIRHSREDGRGASTYDENAFRAKNAPVFGTQFTQEPDCAFGSSHCDDTHRRSGSYPRQDSGYGSYSRKATVYDIDRDGVSIPPTFSPHPPVPGPDPMAAKYNSKRNKQGAKSRSVPLPAPQYQNSLGAYPMPGYDAPVHSMHSRNTYTPSDQRRPSAPAPQVKYSGTSHEPGPAPTPSYGRPSGTGEWQEQYSSNHYRGYGASPTHPVNYGSANSDPNLGRSGHSRGTPPWTRIWSDQQPSKRSLICCLSYWQLIRFCAVGLRSFTFEQDCKYLICWFNKPSSVVTGVNSNERYAFQGQLARNNLLVAKEYTFWQAYLGSRAQHDPTARILHVSFSTGGDMQLKTFLQGNSYDPTPGCIQPDEIDDASTYGDDFENDFVLPPAPEPNDINVYCNGKCFKYVPYRKPSTYHECIRHPYSEWCRIGVPFAPRQNQSRCEATIPTNSQKANLRDKPTGLNPSAFETEAERKTSTTSHRNSVRHHNEHHSNAHAQPVFIRQDHGKQVDSSIGDKGGMPPVGDSSPAPQTTATWLPDSPTVLERNKFDSGFAGSAFIPPRSPDLPTNSNLRNHHSGSSQDYPSQRRMRSDGYERSDKESDPHVTVVPDTSNVDQKYAQSNVELGESVPRPFENSAEQSSTTFQSRSSESKTHEQTMAELQEEYERREREIERLRGRNSEPSILSSNSPSQYSYRYSSPWQNDREQGSTATQQPPLFANPIPAVAATHDWEILSQLEGRSGRTSTTSDSSFESSILPPKLSRDRMFEIRIELQFTDPKSFDVEVIHTSVGGSGGIVTNYCPDFKQTVLSMELVGLLFEERKQIPSDYPSLAFQTTWTLDFGEAFQLTRRDLNSILVPRHFQSLEEYKNYFNDISTEDCMDGQPEFFSKGFTGRGPAYSADSLGNISGYGSGNFGYDAYSVAGQYC